MMLDAVVALLASTVVTFRNWRLEMCTPGQRAKFSTYLKKFVLPAQNHANFVKLNWFRASGAFLSP